MKISTALLAGLALSLGACSSDHNNATSKGDLGTGLNTVDRQYARSAEDTWSAALGAVKSYDLTVDSDAHDAMGGVIKAHRSAGEKVLVRVDSLDPKTSAVSVRVEPGNRNMAEMIHEKIAEKVGLKEAKSTFFGGNTAEGTYTHSLDTCVKAAEDASRRLDLIVTDKKMTDSGAIVDARQTNSIPVRFKMDKSGENVKVTFIAGREKSESMRDLSQRMKTEFENCCTARSN
ncbi:MAG TPA: DUF3568 family protein [Planctomycetota bacterium]|nr:DUF3568 family protein [Planctomycetota bacterium]